MKKGFFIYCERAVVAGSLTIAAISLMGAKSCDLTQDYFFATQAKIADVATATPTGDGLTTLTPTPNGTETIEPTETPEVTGTPESTATSIGVGTTTPTPNGTTTVSATVATSNIFTELKALDNPSWKDTPKPFMTLGATEGGIGVTSDAVAKNWLGNLYNKDEATPDAEDAALDQTPAPDTDSDGDGFTDAVEKELGTNPNDPNDSPRWMITTKLRDAKKGVDDDLDGLTNEQERILGTSNSRSDSDRDGIIDGNEVLSGSSPLDRKSIPVDTDGDGLSDEVEKKLGLDPTKADTDGDGLADGVEQALGTNPFKKDTDGDGIYDGKEYELGSNPLVPESRK